MLACVQVMLYALWMYVSVVNLTLHCPGLRCTNSGRQVALANVVQWRQYLWALRAEPASYPTSVT
jgi:hypothetical protein